MAHGMFGTFLFGRVYGHYQGYYETTRRHSGRWADHEIHLVRPRSEWCGNALIELGVRLTLNAAWSGDPVPIVSQLLAYKENALAAPLLLGGKPQGIGMSLFTLREISETVTHWLRQGRPIRIELELSFLEYMPNMGIGIQIPGFDSAFR
jgi:phage protein U